VPVGSEDERAAEELAADLPDGRYAAVPGDHIAAVTKPGLMGAAIAEFLGVHPSSEP
jgi:hypothetical protein